LGSAKYDALGLPYSYKKYQPFSKEELGKIEKQYLKYFKITKEG
jgi:hypothetical protein